MALTRALRSKTPFSCSPAHQKAPDSLPGLAMSSEDSRCNKNGF
jgi:hypothetical protein